MMKAIELLSVSNAQQPSSFSPTMVAPNRLLSHVDPAKLPTPADALPGFDGPASPAPRYGEISDAWEKLHVKGIDVLADPRKATLVHLVSRCRQAGLVFSGDVKAAVADALELPGDAPEREEYSAFGTELSFASLYLDHLEAMAEEARLWQETPIKAGQKLPALRVDDARVTTVRAMNVHAPRIAERDGQRLALRPARIVLSGRSTGVVLRGTSDGLDVTLTLSARELHAARQAQQQHTDAQRSRNDTEGARLRARPARPDTQTVTLYPQVRALIGGTLLTRPAQQQADEDDLF